MPHFCYLLNSSVKNCQACYIGFTDNPRRRLRCHNGELTNGAHHTSKYRPWEHVCVVSGFPNRIVALQFEWQWQNPKKSRIIKNRESILNQKNIRGYRMSLKVLNSLLETALWKRLNLTIHFIDPQILSFFQSLSCSDKKCVLNSHAELDVMHKPIDDDVETDLNNPVCCICKKSRYCDILRTDGDDDIQTGNGSITDKVYRKLIIHKFKLSIKVIDLR
jgi:predicted GIY-YIG superfamily endonuclease